MTEQNFSDYVYYIADENKITVVDWYTHFKFKLFIFEKTNRPIEDSEYLDLLEKTYNDIVYLGEL